VLLLVLVLVVSLTGVSAAGKVTARLKEQLQRRTSAMRQLISSSGEGGEQSDQGQYETRLLEQSIYKICALLAVGFGDAGAEVIAENIKKEGDLNPIVPGKKMVGDLWFCSPATWMRCFLPLLLFLHLLYNRAATQKLQRRQL
jgi:hypothetical protein